jgi:hypothetical protein
MNTSGQGASAELPTELRGWNWGAFLLHWIWGIGNNTLIALLVFVPLVGLVMPFVLGARGNEWAWRNRRWESTEAFRKTQRAWAIWGAVAWVAVIAVCVVLFIGIQAALKSSDAYRLGADLVRRDAQVAALIGTPVETGTPSGSVKVNGPNGSASLAFSAEGPRGSGTLYLEAVKELGEWHVRRAQFAPQGGGARIDLGTAPGEP